VDPAGEGELRVRAAVSALARGELVVVADDESRENEGDLIVAAESVTPEQIGFIVRHGSGIICVALPGEEVGRLALRPMCENSTDAQGTAFTVSVDLRSGTTTGISAADRANTARALGDPNSRATDFASPGHVFPLQSRDGGVLKRAGHTEAGVDLMRLAGRRPAAVLCEIVDDGGEMVRGEALRTFAVENGLCFVTVADLVAFRRRNERLVEKIGEARIPTEFGQFQAVAFRSVSDGEQHIALVHGEIEDGEDLLVRMHSECLTGDVFHSLRCDCGTQLDLAMKAIAAEGRGVVVYLRGHEGRGLGLGHKLHAYELQDAGRDTVDANLELGFPADARDYGIGAEILTDLGARGLRLLTNNPAKYHGLSAYGLRIAERIPLVTEPTSHNLSYLETKQRRLGHLLDFDAPTSCGTRGV
jgi:3,4-dihydroxy 2-butanone 4-phosphate synthase/GTP cyclohydrolase II